MSNVGVFVDLALAALLLIALVMGWRQGFVQALTRILVVVAALLLAGWIAGKLAEPAARWLEPVLTEKLEQRLTAQGNTSDAGEMLAAFGFEGDTLSKLVDSAVQKAQQAGETLLSAVVSTALRSAAYAVVYVVSFCCCWWCCGWRSRRCTCLQNCRWYTASTPCWAVCWDW